MKVIVTPAETKIVVIKPKTFNVELTQEEIDLIVILTGRVGGSGRARKITDKIYYGLADHCSHPGTMHKLEEQYKVESKGGMYSN
jgi:hypothetical protein